MTTSQDKTTRIENCKRENEIRQISRKGMIIWTKIWITIEIRRWAITWMLMHFKIINIIKDNIEIRTKDINQITDFTDMPITLMIGVTFTHRLTIASNESHGKMRKIMLKRPLKQTGWRVWTKWPISTRALSSTNETNIQTPKLNQTYRSVIIDSGAAWLLQAKSQLIVNYRSFDENHRDQTFLGGPEKNRWDVDGERIWILRF